MPGMKASSRRMRMFASGGFAADRNPMGPFVAEAASSVVRKIKSEAHHQNAGPSDADAARPKKENRLRLTGRSENRRMKNRWLCTMRTRPTVCFVSGIPRKKRMMPFLKKTLCRHNVFGDGRGKQGTCHNIRKLRPHPGAHPKGETGPCDWRCMRGPQKHPPAAAIEWAASCGAFFFT